MDGHADRHRRGQSPDTEIGGSSAWVYCGKRVLAYIEILVKRQRIGRQPFERVHLRKPSHPWIHPSCSVVVEASVGIEGVIGGGVRDGVFAGAIVGLAVGGCGVY